MQGQGTMPQAGTWFRHIGIYAYRTAFLHQFVAWPPAPEEQLESLEQLRALHNGVSIHVENAVQCVPGGIDTEDDLNLVRRLLQGKT
jgi:3-deoxy-manno-octulosonate cytidylyltransferase (CMP-KDO synthetase)